MKRLRTKNLARSWVFLAMFAIGAQLAGFSVHAAMITQSPESASLVKSACHSSGDHLVSATNPSMDEQSTNTCCDGDCPMMACHSSTATVGYALMPSAVLSSVLGDAALRTTPIESLSTLYRPPILG